MAVLIAACNELGAAGPPEGRGLAGELAGQLVKGGLLFPWGGATVFLVFKDFLQHVILRTLCKIEKQRDIERQTDRQTGRQADRQTGRQADTERNGEL